MSAIRFVPARRLLALVGVLALGACSDAATGLPSAGSENSASNTPTSGNPGSSDTTQGAPGEWHLATIRGVVLGTHETSSSTNTSISGATVEIHKMSITAAPPGDSASTRLQDLGVVATLTSDASGGFEYVLSDPIIVKAGQPSPTITYHLTITPPAGSPFAAQSDIQVFFMEQLPATQAAVNYYLYPLQK
jgi:hypothetical protein